MFLIRKQENTIPGFSKRKTGITKIVKITLLIIVLIVSSFPKEAFAGRSGAGGGHRAKFESDDLFRTIGISFGCAVVGSALSSGLESLWTTASTMSNTATSSGYVAKTCQTLGTLFTESKPWVEAGSTLYHSLSSLSVVVPAMVTGYPTYVAGNQVANLAGNLGSYKGWDQSNVYLASTIATSLAAGAINPHASLATSGGNSLLNVGKGALASAAGGTVKALTILSIDREKIRQGKNPGVTSTILGMVAGEKTMDLSRALMDPATYHQVAGIFKREDAKPVSYEEYNASKGTSGSLKGRGPLSQKGYASASGSAYRYDYKTIEAVDSQGNIKYGESVPGDVWESKYYDNASTRYEAEYIAPDIIKITDTKAPFSGKDMAYKLLWKIPVVDTFSRQNFADWAGRSVGIIVEGNLDENKRWYMSYLRPLAKSFSQAISGDIFSHALNIWPVSADVWLGNKSDSNEARLQQNYAVKFMGKEVGMRPFNKNAFNQAKDFDEQVKQLAKDYRSGHDMAKFKEELTGLIEGFKQDLNEKSVLPDREYKWVFDTEGTVGALDEENIEEFLKGGNLPAKYSLSSGGDTILSQGGIHDLERELADIYQNKNLSLGEIIRNEAGANESARMESAMTSSPSLGLVPGVSAGGWGSPGISIDPQYSREISAPEALRAVGLNRWSLAGKIFAFRIPANIFEGVLTAGVEGLFSENLDPEDTVSQQLLNSYAANMTAALVRGAAWHYGWGHLSRNWPWYNQWDFVMPERYTRQPGDADFDFMQYKQSQDTYDEELGNFHRFVGLNRLKPEFGVIYHGERVRFDIVNQKEIKDPRWVATIAFKEEEPPLSYALGRSIEQANLDYFVNTFSFGAPLLRLSPDSLAVGIDPKYMSSASYINYLDSVQNQAQKNIPGVILYNAVSSSGSAIKSAISKSIGGSLLHIPYLPGVFNMQPERLVFAGTLREEKQPRRDISAKTGAMAIEGYQNSDGVEMIMGSNFGGVQEESSIEMPLLTEDKRSDYAGLGNRDLVSSQKIYTDSTFRLGQEIIAKEGDLPIVSGDEEWGIRQDTTYFDQNNKIIRQESVFESGPEQMPDSRKIPIAGGKGNSCGQDRYLFEYFLRDTPAPGAPSGKEGYWKYLVEKKTTSVTWIQDSIQSVYFYADLKAMPSTIQVLSGGSGGSPNLGTTFYAPFPNPLYRLKPQTSPIEYLRGTRSFSAPQAKESALSAVLDKPDIPANSPFFYNIGSNSSYNLYRNNLLGVSMVDRDMRKNNLIIQK